MARAEGLQITASPKGADCGMSKVVPIVPRETRNEVDKIIKDFARGSVDRNTMMRTVADILKYHKIKRLPLGKYEVMYLGQVDSIPVIHIQGKLKVSDTCPACGSSIRRYINTERELAFKEYDIITVFCMDCSCFYRTYGWKVTNYANA